MINIYLDSLFLFLCLFSFNHYLELIVKANFALLECMRDEPEKVETVSYHPGHRAIQSCSHETTKPSLLNGSSKICKGAFGIII